MIEDTMRLLREFTIAGVQTFQCMACDATWTDGRGPERHHDRCRVGNLQILVKSLTRERDALRRSLHGRADDGTSQTAMGVIADWRRWARQILGKLPTAASDASLRYRLESRMRSEASTTERMLRLQIADLEAQLEASRSSQRDLEDLVRRGLER